ncbi:MAG: guanylate kinase [Deltaproteobacteria bacterium]|nr:guanylate kinase [Deltaproteobacteria bacterium]
MSAPSGTGKTSLCDKLRDDYSFIVRSISMTTRPKRDGEVSGQDYEFVSEEDFLKRKSNGEMLETAEVFGRWYGTPKTPVERAIEEGKVIVMDIDTVGAFNVKKILKDDCVTVFILPPSFQELERRLRSRGKNSPEELKLRLSEAAREMRESAKYEYIIGNHDFSEAYQRLLGIVMTERQKAFRVELSHSNP